MQRAMWGGEGKEGGRRGCGSLRGGGVVPRNSSSKAYVASARHMGCNELAVPTAPTT